MSLSSLPAVLVQSLMHSLHAKEILSLARCCKWTLQCADAAFAWRDCPPLELCWCEDAASVVVPSPSRLSHRIPLAIRPADALTPLFEPNAHLLFGLMQSCPRIARLEWREWKLPVERGLQLLSHPSMQQVRHVGFRCGMHAEWLAAAVSLPCLAELDLRGIKLSASELLPLVYARALTKLRVSEWHCECLSAVMQLTQITNLCIHMPRLDGDNFAAFCSAMIGLEELTLSLWDYRRLRSISAADLVAGFYSLRFLRVLSFVYTFDEETLAPVLHHAPALRILTLPEFAPDHKPTRLAQLLQAAHSLHVQLDRPEDREALQRAKQALGSAAEQTG